MKIFKTEKKIHFITKHIDMNVNNMISTKQKFQVFNVNLNSNDLLGKKINVFKVRKFVTTYEMENKDLKIGRWTLKEHIQFLKAIDKFGIKWEKIKAFIPTRTPEQIRSHAQKFYNKLKKYKDEELGIDFTKENIENLKDIINHTRNINSDFNVVNLFLYITEKIYAIKKNEKDKKSKAKNKRNKNSNLNFDNFTKEHQNTFNNNINNSININENSNKNELNYLPSINNNFNNYPVNNISITNLNFINNYNVYNPFMNYLNDALITNDINNINNNMFHNNFQNLNNIKNNDYKELLNQIFSPTYPLNNNNDIKGNNEGN